MNKTIWNYENDIFKAQLIEEEMGILIFTPDGKITLEIITTLFEKLSDYKKEKGLPITLLVNNSKISSIDMKARIYVVDTVSRTPIIERAISFGKNFLFGSIVTIFTSIMSKLNVSHKTFTTEEEALSWAKSTYYKNQ